MNTSIIICTYNGANRIIRTLDSIVLSVNNLPGNGKIELIVVDNNSNDGTIELINNYNYGENIEYKFLHETRKGLSYARNNGLHAAKGDIIIFTDDDIIVDKDWIAEIQKEMQQNPDIKMLGGRTLMFNNEILPLATRIRTDRTMYQYPANPWHIGNGNNMAVKREIIGSIGDFDVHLGAGSKIGSAEDTDFVYRVLKKRYKALYSPNPLVYHNHDRVDIKDVDNIKYNYAKGTGAFYAKYMLHGDIWVAKLLYWDLKKEIKKLFDRNSDRKRIRNKIKGVIFGFMSRLFYEIKYKHSQ
jgi:glycosyltransferase involved in cell wall biosynthesis